MTMTEYNQISGKRLEREPTPGEVQALMVRVHRALAVRRAVAVREIQEQAGALDETDRQKLIKVLDEVSS